MSFLYPQVYGVASYGGPPFHQKHTRLDVTLQDLVNWMTSSMNIREPAGVLVDFIIDAKRCPFQMTAAQLLSFSLGDVLRHCGITDVENSHSIYGMVSKDHIEHALAPTRGIQYYSS